MIHHHLQMKVYMIQPMLNLVVNISPLKETNNNITTLTENNSNSSKIIILSNQIIRKATDDVIPTTSKDSLESQPIDSDLSDAVTWTISKFESSGSEYIPSDNDSDCSEILKRDTHVIKHKTKNTFKKKNEMKKTYCTKNMSKMFESTDIHHQNIKQETCIPDATYSESPILNESHTSSLVNNKTLENQSSEHSDCHTKLTTIDFTVLDTNERYVKKASARERPTLCPICYKDVTITQKSKRL
ncbi:hypothetical protein ABEB36_013946 [Hypothenemus hampei]|uniref:Uncharacterized protein n=1 Tax=Hypothenemus hampei TaxID=57062 RepID=A0ABD1E629_HYPHA